MPRTRETTQRDGWARLPLMAAMMKHKALLLAEAGRELRLQALAAERDELYKVRLARAIDDDVHRQLVREIDLVEASLLQQTQSAH
jgi:hypothetical protein